MGKISLGILDGVSGKVGNVVGASWKGIDYIRAKADHRADPKTEDQMAQRSRFKGARDFTQLLLSAIVRPIWNPAAGRMTGSNLFLKKNMGAFGSEGTIEDYSKLHMSVGKLPLPDKITIEPNAEVESGVSLAWESRMAKGSVDDKLMLVVIDTDTQDVATVFGSDATRGDGNIDLILPFDPRTEVAVYAFFSDAKGKSFSPSVQKSLTL